MSGAGSDVEGATPVVVVRPGKVSEIKGLKFELMLLSDLPLVCFSMMQMQLAFFVLV